MFCIRADGSPFAGDLGRVCTGWLCAMYPSEAPPQGVWEQVPGELLPDGAAVAYFNAHAFFADVVVPSERPAQMSNVESEAVRVMFEEFIATGAHYDETLRAQFLARLRQGTRTQKLGATARRSPVATLRPRKVVARPSLDEAGA